MSSKPWYAWFPADYKAKTAHLSFTEDAAYRRMLDAYYERRAPLPADPITLHRILGAQTDAEKAACETISRQFFRNGDGFLRHARCDEQIAKEERLRKEWVKAGKRGAKQRWGNDRVGHSLGHRVGDGETHGILSPSPHSSLDPRPTPTSTPSVADATGAKAPEPDPIFGVCLDFLKAKGLVDRNARAFLGLVRKQYGDLLVFEVVEKAKSEDVSQPIPWIKKALESRQTRKGVKHGNFGEQDYRSGVGEDGKF